MSWFWWVLLACFLDRTGQSGSERMRRELADHGARLKNVEAQFIQVEARVNQLEELTRSRGKKDLMKMESLDEVRSALGKMRGEVEVLSHQVGEGGKDLKARTDDAAFRVQWLESRADQLEKALGLKAPPAPVIAPPVQEGGQPPQEGGKPPPQVVKPPPQVVKPPPEGGKPPPQIVKPPPQVVKPPQEGGKPPPQVVKPPQEGKPGPRVVTIGGDPKPNPDTMVDGAKGLLDQGNTTGAEQMLERFLQVHPKHGRVAEARYYRAGAAKKAGKYQPAILRYQEVINQHKRSAWAPWAMYKQGECFALSGKPTNARVFFNEVIRLYPSSPAAKAARQKLAVKP